MKKAIFAGIVVLLALTMVTCDLFPPAEKGGDDSTKPKVVYKDGQPWGVELAINVPRTGRSMNGAIAELFTDYYEVAFFDGDQIYRARWRSPDTGRIAVRFGDYKADDPTLSTATPPGVVVSPATTPATGAAIMFAGRYDSKTLLAVGKLTEVNGTTASATNIINAGTTSVTFTLNPLVADVQANKSSSFLITKPDGNDNDGDPDGSAVLATATVYANAPPTGPEFPTLRYKNPGNGTVYKYPVYLIDNDLLLPKTTLATYTITDGTTSNFPHNKSVFIVKEGPTGPAAKVTSGAVLTTTPPQSPPFASFKLTSATITGIDDPTTPGDLLALASAVNMPTTGIVHYQFVAPSKASGLIWVAFEIPVRAISVAADVNGDTWYIRGGLRQYEFDLGLGLTSGPPIVTTAIEKNAFGGQILLATQDLKAEFDVYGVFP